MTRVVASSVLRFSGKRGQRGNVESCMLLENGLTRSLLARASQRSSLAVRKFCTVKKEERFAQGYDQWMQTLLVGEVALETHRNDRSYSSDSGRSTFFERNSLFSVMAYSKFWKVIPPTERPSRKNFYLSSWCKANRAPSHSR